jgi:hypothetical protein
MRVGLPEKLIVALSSRLNSECETSRRRSHAPVLEVSIKLNACGTFKTALIALSQYLLNVRYEMIKMVHDYLKNLIQSAG